MWVFVGHSTTLCKQGCQHQWISSRSCQYLSCLEGKLNFRNGRKDKRYRQREDECRAHDFFFTKTEFHPVVHMESVCHLHIKHNGLVATLFLKGGGQRCTVKHRRWKDSRRILVCQTIKGAFWSWPFVRSNKDRTGGEPLIHWVTVLSEALVGCIMGCRNLWSFSYPDRGLTALFTLSFIYLVE